MEKFWIAALSSGGIAIAAIYVFYSLFRKYRIPRGGRPLGQRDVYRLHRLYLMLVFVFALAVVLAYLAYRWRTQTSAPPGELTFTEIQQRADDLSRSICDFAVSRKRAGACQEVRSLADASVWLAKDKDFADRQRTLLLIPGTAPTGPIPDELLSRSSFPVEAYNTSVAANLAELASLKLRLKSLSAGSQEHRACLTQMEILTDLANRYAASLTDAQILNEQLLKWAKTNTGPALERLGAFATAFANNPTQEALLGAKKAYEDLRRK